MDESQKSQKKDEVLLDASQLSAPNNDLVNFNYEEVPITDIVNNIILDGIKRKASDIHFDPYEKGLRIRMRIDGSLMDIVMFRYIFKRIWLQELKL